MPLKGKEEEDWQLGVSYKTSHQRAGNELLIHLNLVRRTWASFRRS